MENRREKTHPKHKLVDFKFLKTARCTCCNALLRIQICLLITAQSRITYSRLLQVLSWLSLSISKSIQNISRDGDTEGWLRGAFQPQLSCKPVNLLQSGELLPPAEGGTLWSLSSLLGGLGQFRGGPQSVSLKQMGHSYGLQISPTVG